MKCSLEYSVPVSRQTRYVFVDSSAAIRILAASGKTAGQSASIAEPEGLSANRDVDEDCPRRLAECGSRHDCWVVAGWWRIFAGHRETAGHQPTIAAAPVDDDRYELQRPCCRSAVGHSLSSSYRIRAEHREHRLSPRLFRSKQLQPHLPAFDEYSAGCLSQTADGWIAGGAWRRREPTPDRTCRDGVMSRRSIRFSEDSFWSI